MSRDQDISDRHQLEVSGLEPRATRAGLHVQVVLDDLVDAPAAQHLTICLFNLLGRLTDLVASLDLVAPNVPTCVQLPHHADSMMIQDAVSSLVKWAVGEKVQFLRCHNSPPDIRLCIGTSGAIENDGALTLWAAGAGWRAWVGDGGRLPTEQINWELKNPLGPYLAATLLAGEVFKRSRGIKRGRFIHDLAYSLWSGQEAEWAVLEDGPEVTGLELPPLYLVGTGAVGQGLALIVGASRFANAYMISIDDDRHDTTNFNRCFLAGIGDNKDPKILAVSRYRKISELDGFEFDGVLSAYISKRSKPRLRADIAAQERNGTFRFVASCVDKGTSRHDIQGLGPELIVGGSTLNLSAKAIVYDGAPGTPCLACNNPPEQDGEKIRILERHMRAMTEDERAEYLNAKSPGDVDAILSYIKSGFKCGSAGEAGFRALASENAREFSASFTSMAAAVLLASRFFRRTLFPDLPDSTRGRMTTLAFLAGRFADADLAIEAGCPYCQSKTD